MILGQTDLLRGSYNIITPTFHTNTKTYTNLIRGGLSIGHHSHIFQIHLVVG
jgi:hypothetical protein